MNLSDIRVLRPRLVRLPDPADYEAAREELGGHWPSGYREYVGHLGSGVLSGLVRVHTPPQVISATRDFRPRIRSYWFWARSRHLLPKARALRCAVVADTIDGDEVIFDPGAPSDLFFLPRGGDEATLAGHTLFEALRWILTKRHRIRSREFEPTHDPLYLMPSVLALTGTFSSLEVPADGHGQEVVGLEISIVGSHDGYYAVIQERAGRPTVARIRLDFEQSGDVTDREAVAAHFHTPKSSPLGETEFRGFVSPAAIQGTLRFADVITPYVHTSRQPWSFSLPRRRSFWHRQPS